jgi:hypothetical protein
MLVVLLDAGTVWKWAMLPTFRRNILPLSSGLEIARKNRIYIGLVAASLAICI